MEKNEFIKFITDNIGKEVIVKGYVGMLIGYSLNLKLAIVSFTEKIHDSNNEIYTWSIDTLDSADIILVYSPLNVSCYYLCKDHLKFLNDYKVTLEEVISFVQANLGKEVIIKGNKAIIVGYNSKLRCCILSFTNNVGWVSFLVSDIILLHSPLNVSFSLVPIEHVKKLLNKE